MASPEEPNHPLQWTDEPNPIYPAGWLTTDEVAAIAECSQSTVIRACQKGEITNVRRGSGGTWLIEGIAGSQWAQRYRPYDSLRKERE